MRKSRWAAIVSTAVTALVAGSLGTMAPTAQAQETHYYILIGGTCDGHANVYNDAWLGHGIKRVVVYPAGAGGLLPNCDPTPMDQSVAQGYAAAKLVVKEAYEENPGALFTVVGYSQGAIVANKVLNDIADGHLGVDKSRFRAKLYADPMHPEAPPGRGVSAVFPPGMGIPFGGFVSYGPGRTNFGGIPFIRYCIETDGVCHFDTPQAPAGYYAQHSCYQEPRPDGRSIMGDTIADHSVYINAPHSLPKQNCRPPLPTLPAPAGSVHATSLPRNAEARSSGTVRSRNSHRISPRRAHYGVI